MTVTPIMRPPRPLGAAILTALQVIGGIFDILLGTLLTFAFIILIAFGGGIIAFVFLVLAFIAFALGVFSFILAFGLWKGKGWAWMLTLIGAIIGLVLGVLGLVLSGLNLASLSNVVLIVLYSVVIVYLNERKVRAFFGRQGGFIFPQRLPVFPKAAPPMPPQMPQVPPVIQPPITPPPPPATYYPPSGGMPVPPPPRTITVPTIPPAVANCPKCGSPLQPEVNFCDRCGTRIR